ncbi:MAG: glycoside hydrolase family 3 C-terminal domain-containing protein [Bacteroidales bacterium]|nr:glycoside hydrolase family 3 C-terminal domain-containing protein [Bacteroidales bacterium]
MTLEEKVSQMQYTASAIPRLGIQEYNWWNECLHGVARNGIATVFPQAIGMAATWNTALIKEEADIIATEARAKHNEALLKNEHGIYQGLTFWSPNINIFRDPRWGRGQETYGEDPLLTAEIGKAFVTGLQGNDPRYFKVIATAKHFAVHSGPESERHRFDAWPPLRDLYDTYLPAFEVLVKEAKVYSVMSCYNRVYGVPSSASSFLFADHLRNKWGFKGYVVSDCWAISDIYNFHKYVPTAEQASSLSVRAGTDLACGPEYGSLLKAVELGYITEYEIDIAVKRLMEARFRLGMFDPAGSTPYSSIQPGQNDTKEHQQFALKVARESIVLLKNQDHCLPISSSIRKIAVIGPYAADTSVLLGNYNGTPSSPITILRGIQTHAGKKQKISYAQGVERPEILSRRLQGITEGEVDAAGIKLKEEAIQLARISDMVVFVGGISPNLEGEEMDVKVEGFAGGDRTTLDIPVSQQKLLEELSKTGKPIVLILTNGSALSVPWAKEHIPAIVEAWYPGQEGGNAVADVIFGKYNPAGRLPVTFYKSVEDLPAFDNYSMENRTYRYFKSEPLFPFGHGLSFTEFTYGNIKIDKRSYNITDTLTISIPVTNKGKVSGDEVVQLYVESPENSGDNRNRYLVGFSRIHIPAGETMIVKQKVPVSRLRMYDSMVGNYVISKGTYLLMAAASSSDIRQKIPLVIQ